MFVLIVEDNIDAGNSLAKILQMWGFETRLAYDAPAALQIVAQRTPNVVLTDIGLPGMNGFELAEELSSRPEMKGVLLAAVTAYGDEESRQRGKRAGLAEHFCKPVDLVALRKLLETRRAG